MKDFEGKTAVGRNRPEKYSREGDINETDLGRMTSEAAIDSTATGLPPSAMAARVLAFIEQRKFYLLAGDADTVARAMPLFGPFGRLGAKDLDCALACASELGVELPSTRRLRDVVYPLFLNKT